MEENFDIVVEVDGREHSVEFHLATTGYTHKFYATIHGIEVSFEPDEERNYRAILISPHDKISDNTAALIHALGEKIQSAFG